MRKFARELDTDHSTLSQILRGKRPLTAPVIRRFAKRLSVPADDITRYCDAAERWRSSAGRVDSARVRELAADSYAVISEWYHFAILELVQLEQFRPDSRWIANVLDLSVDEVNVAVTRLAHLGLLEMKGDRWRDCLGAAFADGESFEAVALRRLQERLQELMLDAVLRVPADRRVQSSVTMAVSTQRIPDVLDLVAHFQQELWALVGRDEVKDDVYQLEISFFPLTQCHDDARRDDG